MLLSLLLIILSYLSLSFLILTSAFVVKAFYDERITVSAKRVLICLGLTLVFFALSCLLVFVRFKSNQTNKIFTIVWIVFLTVMLLIVMPIVFIYKSGMRKKYYVENCLLFFAVINISMVCEFLLSDIILTVLSLFGVELKVNPSLVTYTFRFTLPCVIGFVMCLWLYFSIIRKKLFLKMRKSDTVLFLLYHILVLYCYSTVSAAPNSTLPKVIRVSQLIFAIILIVLVPVIIIKNRQTAYYSEMSTRNEQFLEAELVASNAYRQSQEDTRAFRHDMNNNLAVVSALMRNKEYGEAENYINALHGRLSSFSPRIVTGDDMLDALISSKLTNIEEKGISFKVSGVIDGGLGWKPIDICAVFANMIDNAVEACERIADGNRYIELCFRKTDHQRIITMKNSVSERVDCSQLGDGSHYTSKTDRNRHGFGVKNIKDTLEKNEAMMQLDCNDTEFMTTIIMMRPGGAI